MPGILFAEGAHHIWTLHSLSSKILVCKSKEETGKKWIQFKYLESNNILLQGIFSIQLLNPGLLHWRCILYQLSYKGSPCNLIIRFKMLCIHKMEYHLTIQKNEVLIHATKYINLKTLCLVQEVRFTYIKFPEVANF